MQLLDGFGTSFLEPSKHLLLCVAGSELVLLPEVEVLQLRRGGGWLLSCSACLLNGGRCLWCLRDSLQCEAVSLC